MPRRVAEPVTKVTINLYTSDYDYLRRLYANERNGFQASIRTLISAVVSKMRERDAA